MIINRAFYREAALTTFAIAAVLLVILVMMSLTFLLGRAARGDQAEDIVFTLLGLQTLTRLDLLLPLAFYLGVLLTLSRWYRDNEMTVLAACGVGLVQLLRPVLVLCLAFALLVSASAFYLTPLATRTIDRVKNESAQRLESSLVVPGVFAEVPNQARIFYVEKILDDGSLENIFVSSFDEARREVVVAKTGGLTVDAATGVKFLVLRHGMLYDGMPGMADYRIVEFDAYKLRIDPVNLGGLPLKSGSMPTLQLFGQQDPELYAELHWRIAKPIALFILVLFAMVFSYTDVRRGRFANLLVAILFYYVYSNLLGFGQSLLKNQSIPLPWGLWWVHASLASIAIYLLSRRARNRPLLPIPVLFRR